jgi:hypothetical protein
VLQNSFFGVADGFERDPGKVGSSSLFSLLSFRDPRRIPEPELRILEKLPESGGFRE